MSHTPPFCHNSSLTTRCDNNLLSPSHFLHILDFETTFLFGPKHVFCFVRFWLSPEPLEIQADGRLCWHPWNPRSNHHTLVPRFHYKTPRLGPYCHKVQCCYHQPNGLSYKQNLLRVLISKFLVWDRKQSWIFIKIYLFYYFWLNPFMICFLLVEFYWHTIAHSTIWMVKDTNDLCVLESE